MSFGNHLSGEVANISIIGAFGVLFGIPAGDTILKFLPIYKNYQASTLQNKLNEYMSGIDRMTPENRSKLRNKIETNRNFKRDVVSVLLEMVDNTCTDMNIDVLCNLTHALAEGHISTDDFYRLSLALRRCIYSDLENLEKYVFDDKGFGYIDETNSSSFALHSAGLLYMPVFGGNYNFVMNDLGEKMVKFGLKKSI